MDSATKRRIWSFIIGGILAAVSIVIGISTMVSGGNTTDLFMWIGIGVAMFTFSSCIVFDNNFVGEVFVGILNWGFVKMPGLIFTLDLDGIIWLITVKLLFWILGIILAILCGLLGFVVASVVSVFVYPFALYNNIKHPDEY